MVNTATDSFLKTIYKYSHKKYCIEIFIAWEQKILSWG